MPDHTHTPTLPVLRPTAGEIRATLEQALAPLSIEVVDDSARHAGHAGAREGGHYRVTLVAPAFAGRPQLERHRMVYCALAPLMGHGIHALSIVAYAPSESPSH
ncbi:MAG: BolA family transcriptional regulator [Proteobacteria bacterium]|nr:BolA family transcriptional regulator [Pseudomonadota bacterium]